METTTMYAFFYPARLVSADPGEIVVRFRDVPEAITSGATEDEALRQAADALAVALEGYLEDGRPWPERSPTAEGEHEVPVDPTLAARHLLLSRMTALKLTKVGLADRLGKDEKAVRRMLAGHGASLEQILQALNALGVPTALAA
jgi:antitoxin HicB